MYNVCNEGLNKTKEPHTFDINKYSTVIRSYCIKKQQEEEKYDKDNSYQ